MVARSAVLFVGVLMFFINDDDADVGQRCENGTAGADNNLCLTGTDSVPFIKAFALREV